MSTPLPAPQARPFEHPFRPDSIDSPTVLYGEGPVVILYPAAEGGQWVRVTFEGFDSLRVCRGEYVPYEELPGKYSAVYLVENSAWLRERYAYEAAHYRGSYEFGGDVDTMLTDFQHYLFKFHDQYVEVLARGVWFEASPQRFELGATPERHPLADLPESCTTERFTVEGITCQVRTDPRPMEELVKAARYCSQPLFHFALELEGRHTVSMSMVLRERRGELRSYCRGYFGNATASVSGIATLEQARSWVDPYIREVRERRRKMGK